MINLLNGGGGVRMREPLNEEQKALVEANLPLVTFVIKKYVHRLAYRMDDYDDLFQIGAIGLVQAVADFDPSRGYKFSSFAVKVILNEVNIYFRDQNAVKRKATAPVFSLDDTVKSPKDGETVLYELIRDARADVQREVDFRLVCDWVNRLCAERGELPPEIATLFGWLTQQQAADKAGCSQSQISRRLKQLKALLRKELEVYHAVDYAPESIKIDVPSATEKEVKYMPRWPKTDAQKSGSATRSTDKKPNRKYLCTVCGFELSFTEAPKFCPMCGQATMVANHTKAEKYIRECTARCKELQPVVEAKYAEFISVYVEYADLAQKLAMYKKRGVIQENPIPVPFKPSMAESLKEYRAKKKEAKKEENAK